MEPPATDDLTARLMATFRAEADEHVEAIRGGLLKLRVITDAGALPPLLEPLVREAHSLRGAARAVGSEPVAAAAARIEDVFERLRAGELQPDAAVLDMVDRVVDVAAAAARDATAGTSIASPATAHPALAKLESLRAEIDDLAAVSAATARRLEELRELADELRDLLGAASAPAEPPPARAGGPTVVLLVEDSRLSRTLQTQLLERAGYAVRTAADGIEAWNVLAAGGVDVVVSDILMSGMDGFELTAKIRGDPRLQALPVILITATETPERRARTAQVGADAFVLKGSAEHQDLSTTIERLV